MKEIVTAFSRAASKIGNEINEIDGQKKQSQPDYAPRSCDFMDLKPGWKSSFRGSSCAGFDGQAI